MLNDFRLHIAEDEEVQQSNEASMSKTLEANQRYNINAFERNVPSLAPLSRHLKSANISIFCNSNKEFNIVNYGSGRVLYGFEVASEIKAQVAQFVNSAPVLQLCDTNETPTNQQKGTSDTLEIAKILNRFKPLPATIDCLVIFGCGIGQHLQQLINATTPKFIILYEPEVQYFQCSILAIEWKLLFDTLKAKGIQIFLQIGKDGRDIISDINELKSAFNINQCYLFKHYNSTLFDQIYTQLITKSWDKLDASGLNIQLSTSPHQFIPKWAPFGFTTKWSVPDKEDITYRKNIDAFKKFYPSIYQQIKDYKCKYWQVIKNPAGEVDLLNIEHGISWIGKDIKKEANLTYDAFNKYPNKDGLILGYNGEKLKHYCHYKYVRKTEEHLKVLEEQSAELSENIESIILFGIGAGYTLENLLDGHKIENLFICEPNTDFFYASLFAIDWECIFTEVEENKRRIYLNIGDDGSNLVRDLLGQFYTVGPYILNNTFFFNTYYNDLLSEAIGKLREQLKLVITMGEYFDHAFYGISHTEESIKRQIPLLTKDANESLSPETLDVPVFLVGNGPSLDDSIEQLQELKEQVIIISCGTSLQVLIKHNIIPDFHAEIEQNRSTFDWCYRTNQLDTLKQISLISCNGIHPDTCDLFKDTFISLKEGESSTEIFLESNYRNHNWRTLEFAFPTVSNLALNLFGVVGFSSIYLFGIDMGYLDDKNHHSKHSGYYDNNQQEIYDFRKQGNTSITVPGNFRPFVYTKTEFKLGIVLMEQGLANLNKQTMVYNCSDGARISGSFPLRKENLLISTTAQQKQKAIDDFKNNAFSVYSDLKQNKRLEEHNTLLSEIAALKSYLDSCQEQQTPMAEKITGLRDFVYDSFRKGTSPFFHYFFGSINYTNAYFSKLKYADWEEQKLAQSYFSEFIDEASMLVCDKRIKYDSSDTLLASRPNLHAKAQLKNLGNVAIITNSTVFAELTIGFAEQFDAPFHAFSFKNVPCEDEFDYVIYRYDPRLSATIEKQHGFYAKDISLKGKKGTLLFQELDDDNLETVIANTPAEISILPICTTFPDDSSIYWLNHNKWCFSCIASAVSDIDKVDMLIPKYWVTNENVGDYLLEKYSISDPVRLYDTPTYTALYFEDSTKSINLTMTGSRLKYRGNRMTSSMLLNLPLSEKAFSEKQKLDNFVSPERHEDEPYERG